MESQEKIKTITINGVEYVEKSAAEAMAQRVDGCEYVIARTYSSGVFAGYLSSLEGKKATILNARRLWYWKGAASLSQLAVDGVSLPKECKFPCEVPKIVLLEAIEIIPCSDKAQKSIQGVPVWKA